MQPRLERLFLLFHALLFVAEVFVVVDDTEAVLIVVAASALGRVLERFNSTFGAHYFQEQNSNQKVTYSLQRYVSTLSQGFLDMDLGNSLGWWAAM